MYYMIPNVFFLAYTFFIEFLLLRRHLSLFHFLFKIHFLSSNLHLQFHEICFVIVFYSFIAVIILKILKFTFSLLFGTHSLLYKSSRVIQLPLHPHKLTMAQ